MHMHMLAAHWAYHRTDPQGMGSKWLQHCSPPMTVYIWRLGTKNRGHIGGLHGWSSVLGRRLWVQAPGRGSFSPVTTFKLCSWQTLTCYTPACITLTDNSAYIYIYICSAVYTCTNTSRYHYDWKKLTHIPTNAHLLLKRPDHSQWYVLWQHSLSVVLHSAWTLI